MVSALQDSGSSGPGSSPGLGQCVISWARNFTLTVPILDFLQVCFAFYLCLSLPRSINGYRKQCWGNLQWTSIPSRGSSNTPSRLHAKETGISSGSVGQFGSSAALPSHL